MPGKQLALLCLVLVSVTWGAGCEMLGLSDPDVPQQPVKKTPPRPNLPPVAESLPELEEEEAYERPEFPQASARSPFELSVDVILPSEIEAQEEDRPVEPLEQFTLAQLTLIGVISETAVPRAMFVDSEGFGHMVKEGDRIGRQGGVITDIRDNEVDIEEGSPENAQMPTSVRTLRLSDTEIRSNPADDELSDAERQALDRLMKSEEGRERLRTNLRDQLDNDPSRPQNPQNTGAGIAPPLQ